MGGKKVKPEEDLLVGGKRWTGNGCTDGEEESGPPMLWPPWTGVWSPGWAVQRQAAVGTAWPVCATRRDDWVGGADAVPTTKLNLSVRGGEQG